MTIPSYQLLASNKHSSLSVHKNYQGLMVQSTNIPSKNRPGIPAEFQRNSRSGLDSGRSPPEFRVTDTRNSGFRWIPGSEFWSPADSGIRVLESGGIPGLEFCHLMAFQSRVWSPVEFRVWSSGVRLKMWRPAEF